MGVAPVDASTAIQAKTQTSRCGTVGLLEESERRDKTGFGVGPQAAGRCGEAAVASSNEVPNNSCCSSQMLWGQKKAFE